MHYLYDHNDYDDKFLKFALTKSLHRGIHNIRHTVARGSILKVSLFCSLQYSAGTVRTVGNIQLTHAKDYQKDVKSSGWISVHGT